MATVTLPKDRVLHLRQVSPQKAREVLRGFLAAADDPETRWEPTPSDDVWFTTGKGYRVSLLDPDPECIDIADIAHALSQQCRFSGHTKVFYSVADHCWHVSRLVPPELALAGLLHDAAEAYLADVPSPVKKLMSNAHSGAYKAAEGRLWRAICTRFGIPPKSLASIKHADLVATKTEMRDLFDHDLHDGCEGVQPDSCRLLEYRGKPEWSPKRSRIKFLERFRALTENTPSPLAVAV